MKDRERENENKWERERERKEERESEILLHYIVVQRADENLMQIPVLNVSSLGMTPLAFDLDFHPPHRRPNAVSLFHRLLLLISSMSYCQVHKQL